MQLNDIRFDCKFFRGEIPCIPNKLRDKVCTCDEYKPFSKRILIIKLGALGDVIRSTPLVAKYREVYPDCHISWITLSPEVLPKESIDRIYKMDFASVYSLTHQKFDIAVNLDKEIDACSLLSDVTADEKYGFIWKDHHIDVATPAATHKLITGLFDNISKENKKSYPEEIFEICGFKFNYEPYLLNINTSLVQKWESLRKLAAGKPIVGLNTGCGKRWSTRLWPTDYWINLIKQLQNDGYYPIVLGGPDEDAQNKIYSQETGVYYPGTFSLEEFIALTANCDIIVSAVSMMMHIAVALQKPLILFNNIFNGFEFELYGRGEVVQPDSGCDDFYGNICTRKRHCMLDLPVDKVFKAIKNVPISITQ